MRPFKPILFFVSITSVTLILFSCQKEIHYGETRPYKPTNPIVGTWDFMLMDAKTQSVKEFNAGGFNQRSEAVLNYVTENNSGRMIINDSIITTIGLTYTIASNIKTYNYKNGILIDSNETPYNLSFYEPQSACRYKMIGSDSIYFPKGGFTNISASTFRTDPLAAKINVEGNKLTFKEYIYKDSTEVKLGTVYHTIQTGTAVMTLQRK